MSDRHLPSRDDLLLESQAAELATLEHTSLKGEVVFGSIDGLLAVLGIVSAAGSASLIPKQIFTTALGGAVAGSLSVFAATYLSETSKRKGRLLEALTHPGGPRKGLQSNNQRTPSGLNHPTIRRRLTRINRSAILSGFTIGTFSMLSSLALLMPLILFSQDYSVTASMGLGIFLLFLLGAFRGVSLKQSRLGSAAKMVVLGIAIIILSRIIGAYVVRVLTV